MSTKNTVSREPNAESEVIGRRIYIIRSQKVVLSTALRSQAQNTHPGCQTQGFSLPLRLHVPAGEARVRFSKITDRDLGERSGPVSQVPSVCLYGAGSRDAVECPQQRTRP